MKDPDTYKMILAGLEFIGRNISTVMDKQIVSPIGFNLIFPGMFNHAIRMGLEFPVRETDISGILHLREMELRRCVMKNAAILV